MFFPGAGQENAPPSINPEIQRKRYRFSFPMWLVYGIAGFSAVRFYGYAWNCWQVQLSDVFNAMWGIWLLLFLVPIVVGFLYHYTGKDPIQPWQITMVVGLGMFAIVAYCAAEMQKGVC